MTKMVIENLQKIWYSINSGPKSAVELVWDIGF